MLGKYLINKKDYLTNNFFDILKELLILKVFFEYDLSYLIFVKYVGCISFIIKYILNSLIKFKNSIFRGNEFLSMNL